MKLFTGWAVSAALVLTAAAANAQTVAPYQIAGSPYRAVSDVSGRYATVSPEGPVQRYGPALLPPNEVYTVVRENGFSPLGAPQPRGLFYVIAVVDRRGDDGRLVIDARDGRIIRFRPAYRVGDNYNDDYSYGPPQAGPAGPLPPMASLRGPPRPPASVPHVASRTPMPKPSPLAAKPAAEPVQQSAAVVAKPVEAPPPAAAPAPTEAKPAPPPVAPTQAMPKVQGLE